MRLRIAVPQHQTSDYGGIATFGRGLAAGLAAYGSTAVSVLVPGQRLRLQGPTRRWAYEQTILAAAMRKADVVHMSDLRVPALLRRRVVAAVHDIAFVTHPHLFDAASRHYKTLQLKTAVGLRPALIACDSEYTRATLAARYPAISDRITVLVPGISAYTGPPHDPRSHKQWFLTLGSYDRRKNLQMLLRAFRALRGAGSKLEWIAVGATERAPRDLLRAMRSEPGVTVTGRASDVELERLWAGAAFLSVPSVLEGFGFPGLEAMQRSVPVIASEGSALDETVGPCGIRPPPQDPRAWTEAMRELDRSDTLRAQLAQAGLVRAAKFSWNLRAPAFLKAYHAVAASAHES